MAGVLGRKTINPAFTGGFSQGGRKRSSGGQRLSTTQAPADVYKVFPKDTGRDDVAYGDRFRTGPADAKSPGYGYMYGNNQIATTSEDKESWARNVPGGTNPITSPLPGKLGDPEINPMRTHPILPGQEDTGLGDVTLPEKPSYLNVPELPDATEEFKSYEAKTREVQPEETMQGQMHRIMEEGNPLMDLRRQQADKAMAARGLYHSASGVEAAERAMLEAILPIASQDAATYSNQARINQEFIQNAANMDTETFNNEVTARANQGRQLQTMQYESDIREYLAGVDQRYAVQLETLKQEYDILGEQYKQAGTLYSDSLRSIAAVLGNNQLTPEQQAAAVESLVGQLEAGLQFVTGVSGGTTGEGTIPNSAPVGPIVNQEDGAAFTETGAPVDGISNNARLGVFPGGEIKSTGRVEDVRLRQFDPLEGMVSSHAPDPEIMRVDQSTGIPTLMKIGIWYYRPKNWTATDGTRNVQALSYENQQYVEMVALTTPEVQRRKLEYRDYLNSGGKSHGAFAGGFMEGGVNRPPSLFAQIG